MSEKFFELPKYRNYDTRTFIEIWYSLPEAARQTLNEELVKRKIKACSYMAWFRAERMPKADSIKRVRAALKSCFGLNTLPYTLFPEKHLRQALAKRYMPKIAEENSKVKWPTMEKELNEDPQEDELKYLDK